MSFMYMHMSQVFFFFFFNFNNFFDVDIVAIFHKVVYI